MLVAVQPLVAVSRFPSHDLILAFLFFVFSPCFFTFYATTNKLSWLLVVFRLCCPSIYDVLPFTGAYSLGLALFFAKRSMYDIPRVIMCVKLNRHHTSFNHGPRHCGCPYAFVIEKKEKHWQDNRPESGKRHKSPTLLSYIKMSWLAFVLSQVRKVVPVV